MREDAESHEEREIGLSVKEEHSVLKPCKQLHDAYEGEEGLEDDQSYPQIERGNDACQ